MSCSASLLTMYLAIPSFDVRQPPCQIGHYLLAIPVTPALEVVESTPDIRPERREFLRSYFVTLLNEPEPFTDDLTGGVVHSALDLCQDHLF